MRLASIKNGSSRRVTAATTESFEGCIRHASSGAASGMIVAAMNPLVRRFDALPRSGATLPEPVGLAPTRSGFAVS